MNTRKRYPSKIFQGSYSVEREAITMCILLIWRFHVIRRTLIASGKPYKSPNKRSSASLTILYHKSSRLMAGIILRSSPGGLSPGWGNTSLRYLQFLFLVLASTMARRFWMCFPTSTSFLDLLIFAPVSTFLLSWSRGWPKNENWHTQNGWKILLFFKFE